jgi:hypothetical protein
VLAKFDEQAFILRVRKLGAEARKGLSGRQSRDLTLAPANRTSSDDHLARAELLPLVDGEEVVVDGNRGTVERIGSAPPP